MTPRTPLTAIALTTLIAAACTSPSARTPIAKPTPAVAAAPADPMLVTLQGALANPLVPAATPRKSWFACASTASRS